jgi:hypothetical protein
VRRRDRIIGVLLGIVLGVGVIVGFVFLLSGHTVDAPSLSGAGTARPHPGGEGAAPNHHPPVATVRVVHGAQPESGPAELQYRSGDRIRLRVVSDADIKVELLGYGIDRAVHADRPATIRFTGSKTGSFPLVVTASHIDLARIRIGRGLP